MTSQDDKEVNILSYRDQVFTSVVMEQQHVHIIRHGLKKWMIV